MGHLFHAFGADDLRLNTVIGVREHDLIRVDGGKSGVGLYGPYVDLPPGSYEALIRFDPSTPCRGTATMDACSGCGVEVLADQIITAQQIGDQGSSARIEFSSTRKIPGLE